MPVDDCLFDRYIVWMRQPPTSDDLWLYLLGSCGSGLIPPASIQIVLSIHIRMKMTGLSRICNLKAGGSTNATWLWKCLSYYIKANHQFSPYHQPLNPPCGSIVAAVVVPVEYHLQIMQQRFHSFAKAHSSFTRSTPPGACVPAQPTQKKTQPQRARAKPWRLRPEIPTLSLGQCG